MNNKLLLRIDLPSMPNGNDGNDEPAVIDLINDAVITDPDAVGIPAFEFFAGEPITELMRWEEGEWEMFAGPGPEVQKEDIRVVSLGTILGLDNTLLPAVHLEIGKGLWRTDKDSEWQNWG